MSQVERYDIIIAGAGMAGATLALAAAQGGLRVLAVDPQPFSAQLAPTLTELRALIRDLRALSGRLEGNPARYILGRDAPKEFDPK